MLDTTDAAGDVIATDDIAALDPAVAAAARQLAEAEISAEAATRAAREAEDAIATVRGRLTAMDTARREIGRRRVEGDVRDDDVQVLGVLHADGEALTELAARREADVAAARATAAQRVRDLDLARHQLGVAEDAAALALLRPHLDKLAALVVEGIAAANEIAVRRHNHRPVWVPSRALVDAIRRLDLTRDQLVR